MAHWDTAVDLLACLKGMKANGILLGGDGLHDTVVGYADSDWGNDTDNRISVSGWGCVLGVQHS